MLEGSKRSVQLSVLVCCVKARKPDCVQVLYLHPKASASLITPVFGSSSVFAFSHVYDAV